MGDKIYVAMNADGTALAADPSIKYYTIKEETAKPVSLTYKGTGTDNYLEAVYKANAGTGSTTAYGTDAATAQTIVDNGSIV